ncbi:hypothetical protein Taro_054971 [Colocasia esculenta]|uniref:Uncharacterized protein n=1 Tax=Colocasia esculenta TaxID=4460 RepID=A0A843XQ41_COLES|nr:hypothetical protein [Colocasia esculenta]
MSESFKLKVQRLENTMSAKFIEQKAASDHAIQRFNRLIGTLADASIELKEHQDKLEMVLQGILANSQADVFNTKETLTQISKTILSFAHLVDDLESMKNLSAHIDSEMTDLKKELKNINKYGLGSSSSSAQPSSVDLSTLQYTMSDNRTYNFFKGSVDTPHTGVDTMLQVLCQKMKKWSSSVDTRSNGVDTRDFSQKACFAVFTSVSTRDEVVSTLETSPREVRLPVWDSVSTLDQVRSTNSGNFVT